MQIDGHDAPVPGGAAPRSDLAVSFGVSLYTGQAERPGSLRFGDLTAIAHAAEAAGFDAFWVSEHHDFDDGYLPSPLVGLAAVAQATTTITLGTGLALAPLAHPLRLAEDAVVVDHLSGGRLLLGLGIGYVPQEFRMFGVPMAGRGQRLAEAVAVMRLAWLGERFSYHGQAFSFDDVRVRPGPVRPDGIPIWLGGYARSALERAARLADGHLVGRGSPEVVEAARRHLSAVRDPGDPRFTLAMNLAVAGDDPAAGGDSARAAFARQQRRYEQVQAGTDVYADQLTVSAGADLDLGAIDGYFQLRGPTSSLVDGIVDQVAANRGWARQHLVLRVLFPDEELEVIRRRLAYLGDAVLPEVRRRLAAAGVDTKGAR
jgi:probable F420-dependent oxidoreductase